MADSLDDLIEKLLSDARQQQTQVFGSSITQQQDRDADSFLQAVDANSAVLGVHTDRGPRDSQEDRWVVIPDLRTACESLTRSMTYVAVFDGHEGSSCAEFCRKHMHRLLVESEHFPDDMDRALCDAFLGANEGFLGPPKATDDAVALQYISGCTALVIVLDWDSQVYYAAHAGDSRAILVLDGGEAVQLTDDHTGKLLPEAQKQRIKESGVAMVIGGYIWMSTGGSEQQRFSRHSVSLEVSRAIGDPLFKKDYNPALTAFGEDVIPARPETHRRPIDPHALCIVLGSDGLYKSLSNSELGKLASDSLAAGDTPKACAAKLVGAALQAKCGDNTTCVVVRLSGPPPRLHGCAVESEPPPGAAASSSSHGA